MHLYLATTHPFFTIELNMLKVGCSKNLGAQTAYFFQFGASKKIHSKIQASLERMLQYICYCGMAEVKHSGSSYLPS